MFCPECGEYLAETILQGEAQLLVHRLLRHADPMVQAAVGVLVSALATWLVVQIRKGLT
jgi:hypothetical protein